MANKYRQSKDQNQDNGGGGDDDNNYQSNLSLPLVYLEQVYRSEPGCNFI